LQASAAPPSANHTRFAEVSDGRTTRHPGYAVSQRIRKRIEEIFGWLKTVAGWRKSRFRGLGRTEHGFHLALAAYNLTRMPKLLT
jgi:hypothetical protein